MWYMCTGTCTCIISYMYIQCTHLDNDVVYVYWYSVHVLYHTCIYIHNRIMMWYMCTSTVYMYYIMHTH